MSLDQNTSSLGENKEFFICSPSLDESVTNQRCENVHAQIEGGNRIMVLGGWPDGAALEQQTPFAGAAGNLLFGGLRRYGINAANAHLAYVSPVQLDPHKNLWREPAIVQGLSALREVVGEARPNIILLLGDTALQVAFTTGDRKVEQWRGSVMTCDDSSSVLFGYKVIPTYTPMDVFIDQGKSPLLFFDLARFAENSHTAEHKPTVRDFELYVSADRAIRLLQDITDVRFPVAMDIEGGVTGISCVSYAVSSARAFIVPLATYSDYDRRRVLRAMHRFNHSSTPKILQNQLYDNFVFSYTYRSPIRNVIHDTMLSGWEIYPELPKSLAVQTSIWTDQPYYKMGRKSSDTTTLHAYCCTDSCVT